MSEEIPNHPDDDERLEAELRKLVPSSLNAEFLGRLKEQADSVGSEQSAPAAKPMLSASARNWLMFGAMGVCLLLGCTSVLLTLSNQQRSNPAPVAESIEPPPPPLEEGALDTLTDPDKSRFLPISSEGYLMNASSGEIIQSANGPQRRVELEFQDVDHWHNPETATNIRIFSPRREVIAVPIQTD